MLWESTPHMVSPAVESIRLGVSPRLSNALRKDGRRVYSASGNPWAGAATNESEGGVAEVVASAAC